MTRVRPYQHAAPGSISFGAGLAASLAEQRPLKRAERVLVVSDAGVKGAGLLERVTRGLHDRVALVDDQAVPDGDVAHVDALAAQAKEANVDAIVAVGGGSVMDTAKGVAVVLARGGSIRDYEGFASVRAKLPPLVCVPTTAGTGSECTQFLVLMDRARGQKVIIADLSVVPALGVLDPELVVGLPERTTAATSVDALTHAVEALASRMKNPFGVALATEAARVLVAEGTLQRCLEAPDDIEARGRALNAASMAGQAISVCMLGACHAFAHALGALKGVPHGVANGAFLVPVMRFNLEKARSSYARLGQALGGQGDETALAEHAISEVERVVHEVARIPRRLSELGVDEGDVERLAEMALADPDLATNPVQITEVARASELIRARL